MASLKHGIKQMLINKQHKMYEKKVLEKKMSYAVWIEKQEDKIEIDNILARETTKCLTNDFLDDTNGSEIRKNEGFHSKNEFPCRNFVVYEEESRNTKKVTFCMPFCGNFNADDWKGFLDNLKECDDDIILLAPFQGELSKKCLLLLYREFVQHENIIMIYGDEDIITGGQREKPWFKPDWSPDAFLSCYYFGSLTAVRTKALKEFLRERKEEIGSLYALCYCLLEKYGGFSRETLAGNSPVCHIPEVLFHGEQEGYGRIKDWKLSGEVLKGFQQKYVQEAARESDRSKEALISVIIPSKDNPEVLFHCIHSLIERTQAGCSYEIRIVDNGSSEHNRTQISKEIEELNQAAGKGNGCEGIYYHYEPMTFNFSRMCNIGAGEARGELLLFLNDDMEIIQPDWLALLLEKALLPYAGAVGAKLLYPDSAVIQHAGITNLRVGPAHKLQFLSDEQNHYYGKNRGVHDMLAVTGACLMVRKDVFEQAGGFSEELAVAFNDVDLCYTIYEAGYYNIVRNDVTLYHHESLSRGKDGESEEKQLRLLKEKDILYERHQDIYGKDPFYHKYLTTDMLESEYSPAFRYQVTLDMPWAEVTAEGALPENIKEDACVVIGMECAMDIYKWKYGVAPEKGKVKQKSSDMGYYFQGYSFVIGADNACYKKTLILQNKENLQVIKVPVDDRYRQDIKNNLKDQLNVDLTGFAAKVQLESIPEGIYRFGMLAEDRCSRQKLVNFSSWVLKVERRPEV